MKNILRSLKRVLLWAGLVLLAGPALAAGGPIDAVGSKSASHELDANALIGAGPAGWTAPAQLQPAGPRGSGGVYAAAGSGLIRLDPQGAITFWPRSRNGDAGGSLPFGGQIYRSKLPVVLSNPILVGFEGGFLVIGALNGATSVSRAYWLRPSAANGGLMVPVELPQLPRGLSFSGAAATASRVFLATADGSVIASDLALAGATWRQLPKYPAPTTCQRVWPVTQYDGETERLHLACYSGIDSNELQLWRWREGRGEATDHWQKRMSLPLPEGLGADSLMAVLAHGQSNLLVFQQAGGECGAASCAQGGTAWIYNTVIDRWRSVPIAFPAADRPVLLGSAGQVLALSNLADVPELSQFAFRASAKRFGWLDMSMIALYLIAMVLVGWWFKARNTSTEEFFRGGQSIPWWAAALSIHAALLSSLTYLGLPALVYRTNWIMFMGMIILILITPVIVYWIMPFFRRIDATSAYEYLSLRFNMQIRRMASALFAIFHIGRTAIILSLCGLALASVTPLAPWQSVLLMGVLSITYSTMGGVEAVVWTEALQTLVLSVGALLCFYFLLQGIDGGFPAYVSMGLADGKFRMVDWNFGHGSWLTFAIWVVVLGGIGQNLSTYGADQAVIQRYLVTKTEKKAASAIWLNALATAPSGIIFFLIGSGLYYFYRAHPERLDPSIQIDQIFPTFIANEVPTGVAGLIIAGVFAATQSSVATSMHSISTTLVVDFLRPSGIKWSDEKQLTAARWFTVLVGALGTGIGLVFINPTIRSLFEAYMAVIGMSMGALGGLFLAGMTTRRVGSLSAFLGLCAGVAIMVWLWLTNAINPYLFSAVGVSSCYGLAWLFSLVIGPARNDLTNLTVLTMTRANTEGRA